MPGPYDYTVNIPQPPAQNFLQSLMGIQQLQGLQQQQELSQQQAQFQAQMQPLQIQTEQARLGQIGQATATGAEALRQGKITFEQGQQDRVRQMEQQAIAQAQTQKIFGEIQALPASASIEEITKKVNMLTLINPTAAKQIGENFNQLQKQYQENAKLTAAKAGALLDAGEYEKAAAVYAQAADAVEANAGDNEILKNLANGYKIQANLSTANPVGAKSAVASLLGVVDPAALNAITAARKQEDSSKTGEVEIKDVFTKKLLKDSIDKAKEYSEKADTALSILDKIDSGEVSLPSGFIGNAVQYVRDKVPALANDITALKKDYIRLKNSEAIKNLPKGSASDKDVTFAKEGLMSENANPTQFRNAVEAMARLNSIDSTYNEAQAAWVSRNGNIGDSKREISVLGTTVPKGTGFREWWKSTGGTPGAAQSPTQAPTKTDQITGTPALVPAGGTPADVDAILKQFGVKK